MKAVYKNIFILNVLFAFLLVGVQMLGVSSSKLLSPLSSHVDVFDAVLPKLEEHKNTYTIYSAPHLVAQAQASSAVDDASAYAIVDVATGEILQQKNISDRLPIASLTKIMTAVVSMDLLTKDEKLTVSQTAASIEPTRAGFLPGEQLTTTEVLHALLLTSANDAAQVLKENVDRKYGGDVFIRAMNAKAAFLGLTDSHFENPQGFDDSNHLSSVHDLAILTHYALTTYPLLSEIVRKDYMQLSATDTHKQYDLYNWNGLLDVYPQTIGVKIGNTDAAQKTTVVVSNRGNKQIMAVVLGAPTILDRDMWAAQLLDIGYEKTLGLEPVNVTERQLREKYATWKYWN